LRPIEWASRPVAHKIAAREDAMIVSNVMVVIFWGITAIMAAFGAYFGSYFRKKGENLATHEDIGKLVDQVRAVTMTAKEIEANISDRSWNRQKHWEMKREAIFSVMASLGRADEALHTFALAAKALEESKEPGFLRGVEHEARHGCYQEIEDFDMKRALALIVCGKEMNDALMSLKLDLRLIASQLREGKGDAYDELAPKLHRNYARAYAFARRELGIRGERQDLATSQSNGSSATPSPDSRVPE
jgi:hypothetical protein